MKLTLVLGLLEKKNNLKPIKIDINDFKKLKFKDYYYNNKEFMNIIPFDEALKII